jgi:hypothetical protein
MNKRSHATRDSVINLIKLLDAALTAPVNYVAIPGFRLAVTSQLKLAAFDDPEHGILGSSLNTFKKICAELGEGFYGVEILRLKLDRAFSKLKKDRREPGSRRSLQDEKQKLIKDRASQDVDLHRFTIVVTDLLALCSELVTLDLVDRERYYKLEIERIMRMLGTRRL